MLLAISTITRSASCGLWDDAGVEQAWCAPEGEAEVTLAPALAGLLAGRRAPTAIALAAGPGSFAGLRVGVVTARTLAWTFGVPVHAVDSLAAAAAERGDGLWWVLLPLKRDTTFHGLFRIADGRVETLAATAAQADAGVPVLHPATASAVAVGPALAGKPGLAERWCPGIRLGDAAGPGARGVARLARQTPAQPWRQVLPAYHQEPAPVLQRAGRV